MRQNITMLLLAVAAWFSVITASHAQADKDNIATGIIVDEQGEPLIGATVMVEGTSSGVISDYEGRFSIVVPENARITVSYVGYTTKHVKAENRMRIRMMPRNEDLDELVVVGYGTQKRENLTGAVSTVDVGKVLESKAETDLARALQGSVPGLTITTNSGELDAEPSMVIRGMGTLSSNACHPLTVVNGIPMDDISFLNPADIEKISVLKDAASTSIYGTRAAFGVILITTKQAKKDERFSISYKGNFAFMTPTIVPEYPSVPTQLKAMIAANDRMGNESELFGMQLKDLLPLAEAWVAQNGDTQLGYQEMHPWQSDSNVGDFKILPDGKGLYYANWDVNDILFNMTRPQQTHNISAKGSTGATSFYLSFGHNKQEGFLKYGDDDLKKNNFSMNIQTKAYDWLTIGGRLDYSSKNRGKTNSQRNPYQYLWRWGSFFGPYGSYQGHDFRTEVSLLKQGGVRNTKYANLRMTGFLKAEPVKGLTLNADYTYIVNRIDQKRSLNPVTVYNSWGGAVVPTTVGSTSHVRQYAANYNSYALNVYAEYAMKLKDNHNFKFMLGANAEEGEDWELAAQRTGLYDYALPEFTLANGDQTIDGSHLEWGACGYFGRINYDYRGIYLLELNGRYDGSSKFPANHHWAFFPSGSVGYRFSEEPYFKDIKPYVNNAKARISFGEIGNQEMGNFQYVPIISNSNVGWIDRNGVELVGYDMPRLVSNDLKWERIQTLDLGIDLGFLKNQLNVTFDWFQRTTRDMLAPSKTLPQVLGTDEPVVNAGTLRTRGWELSVAWRHTFEKGLNLYAQASVSDYKSVITHWNNDSRLLNSYYSGKVVGDIWGFETERLFTDNDFIITQDANGNDVYTPKTGIASQKLLEQGKFVYGPGDIKFKDLDGNGVIDAGKETDDDHGDLKVIGNTTPRYEYAFRLGGSWKGFDLDLFFQGIGKRSVWTTSSFMIPFAQNPDALFSNQTDYYDADPTHPNPGAFYPRGYAGSSAQGNISVLELGRYNFYPQSRYLVNMAYLRFKNFTLGYTLPKHLTGKAHIQKARVYINATNLCELINRSKAPVDPEINYGEGDFSNGCWGRTAPMARTYSMGIDITF